MEFSQCLGCMKHTEGYPCTLCGFDPKKQPNPEHALPLYHILRGRYVVGRMLGQGGFGITYIGWDLMLDKRVAIKEYFPNGQVSRSVLNTSLVWGKNANTEDLRRSGIDSFIREAKKMAQVDHIAEIACVRDTFQDNDSAYIIMDFADGETLKKRLADNGPMTWEQAAPIFFSVTSAMQKVHAAGLIHRDISPDNIMLQPDGTIKILDLGAAKDFSVSNGLSSQLVTKHGFSPYEQYTSSGGTGPWSDVYALAATIYYTITGKMPPTAADRMEEDTLNWDLPQLQALPENVLAALQKALKIRAKERTQSMEDFLDQLKSSPRPEPKPKRKPGRKPPVAIIILVILLAALCLGLGIRFLNNRISASEPGAQTASQPTTEPTTEAATEPTTEATTEATTEPTAEATTEPTTEAATEPTK